MLIRLFPLALATFAIGTDTFVIAGLLPAISEDLGVSVTAAGQLVTVFALTFAVSASVLGAALSGLNRRTAILIALTVFVIGNVLTAVGPSYGFVMAGRVITAVGAGTITASASAIAATIAPPGRRAWAMSIVLGGMSVATTVGLPLGTLVGGLNWRLTLWLIAGLGVIAMVGVVLRIPALTLPATSLGERLAPLRQPGIVAILATTTLIFGSTYAIYTYIAAALDQATTGSVRVLTVILFGFGLGTVVGTLVSGRLSDRYPPEGVLVANLVVTVVVLASGLLLTTTLLSATAWVATWGVCAAASTVPQQARLVRGQAAAMPVLLGLNSSAIYLGISLGGGFGGLMLHWVRPHQLVLPAAVLTGLALAITLIGMNVRSRQGRRSPPGTPDAPGRSPAPARRQAGTRAR